MVKAILDQLVDIFLSHLSTRCLFTLLSMSSVWFNHFAVIGWQRVVPRRSPQLYKCEREVDAVK